MDPAAPPDFVETFAGEGAMVTSITRVVVLGVSSHLATRSPLLRAVRRVRSRQRR